MSDRESLLSMYDYTPQAKAYWWVITLLGTGALLAATVQVAAQDSATILKIALGVGASALAGMFPVRTPGSRTSVAGADVFVFLVLFQFGPAAAVIAAAAEAAAGSWRTSARWTSRLGSPAMVALAMYGCGTLYAVSLGQLQADPEHAPGTVFAVILMAATLFFAVTTLLMVSLLKLKRGEPIRPVRILAEHGWLGIRYVASAAIAFLLHASFGRFGIAVLLLTVPIVALLLSTLSATRIGSEPGAKL